MHVTFKLVCPHGVVSGGPEALHQLGQALRAAGHIAEMVYLPIAPSNLTPEKFRQYGNPLSTELPDRPDIVVVLPELMTQLVWRFKRAQVVIWWLSVDNHFSAIQPKKWTKRAKLWLRNRWPPNRAYDFQPHANLHHAWQSEYARRFLLGQGVATPLALTDYISPDLIQAEADLSAQGRCNQVLFNPLKGKDFTEALRAACAGDPYEFVPLKGYTATQMRGLLGSAKAYIDFGEHPGRDRIPREAGACGCVVVTGQRGSAGNNVDVPLPDTYKVDEYADAAISQARALLAQVMVDTPAHLAAQQGYRTGIRGQRQVFVAEAAELGEFFSRRLSCNDSN